MKLILIAIATLIGCAPVSAQMHGCTLGADRASLLCAMNANRAAVGLPPLEDLPEPVGKVAGPVGVATPRDPKQVYAFRKINKCPSTGKFGMGACPGWVVDHVIPLCWGGPDWPQNMQWQEERMSYLKDRFEREACSMKKKLEAAESRGK